MKRTIRPIRVDGNVAYVTLTKGHEAIIDVDDLHVVDGYNWCALETCRRVYAVRSGSLKTGPSRTILMHREILRAQSGLEVDHIEGVGLDNRKKNLRIATRTQNGWNARDYTNNTSGARGVCWCKNKQAWFARIRIGNGKRLALGYFSTVDLASLAYQDAARKFHGEFSRL